MLFNSIEFCVFLPVVFALYWLLRERRAQNLLLLVASYVFYGWWDWRFTSLLALSTVVDLALGPRMEQATSKARRRAYLGVSLAVNLGVLAYFKYANFFIDSFVQAFTFLGQHPDPAHLDIVLPVGISFYTFQTLSYTIDVYRDELRATREVVAFGAFVSFFPQLVAGPIERARHLLPQFQQARTFDRGMAVDGLRQVLWGAMKKMVIADNCAMQADAIFAQAGELPGSTLFLGAIFFAFQIYGDFSGYSDMAIGIARLFGFDLMRNFAHPYFSRDIAEFWRRWHISLSTWFRDYLYIPLGGSRVDMGRRIRNTAIIFLVSGLWHGANWTFVVWGALNALYFLPIMLRHRNRVNLGTVAAGRTWPTLRELTSMLLTFTLVTLAWVFFRAESIGHAVDYLAGIASPSLFTPPVPPRPYHAARTLAILFIFVLMEWRGRESAYAIQCTGLTWSRGWRHLFYYVLILLLLLFRGQGQQFIYFQF